MDTPDTRFEANVFEEVGNATYLDMCLHKIMPQSVKVN